MIIHKHFQEAMIFKNYFFMVRRTCVQPPLLARLAMATSGEPSTWLPLGKLEGQEPLCYYFPENLKFSKNLIIFQLFEKVWILWNGNERWTVNLVTARETRRAGAPSTFFSRKFEIFKKKLIIFQLFQKSGTDRTLKFQSHFHIPIPFL